MIKNDSSKKIIYGITSLQGERLHMEDRTYARVGPTSLFAVFDGHGGGRASDYAALYLPDMILSNIDTVKRSKNYGSIFYDAFILCDKNLRVHLAKNNALDHGTTALVCWIGEDSIVTANAGDSRAILNENGVAVPLSCDHKPYVELERKRIENNKGWVQFDRVMGILAMSRALGDFYAKNEESSPENQWVSPVPEVMEVPFTKNCCQLVLATDGIWDVLSNEEVVNLIHHETDPQLASHRIVKEAIKKESLDNLTALVVDFR